MKGIWRLLGKIRIIYETNSMILKLLSPLIQTLLDRLSIHAILEEIVVSTAQ